MESGAIRDYFRGKQMRFTVCNLLIDAVSESENTAADALRKLVGNPNVVTALLQGHGVAGMRGELGESDVGKVFEELEPDEHLPGNETDAQQLARPRRGYAAYLIDPRNRSTPEAAISFLKKLWREKLLSPGSTKAVIHLMLVQTVSVRLRARLPHGV